MKAYKKLKIFTISLLGSFVLFPLSSMAQAEYDDMYFTPKDRKEIKSESIYVAKNDKPQIETEKKDVINPSYSTELYGNAEENYSAKNVNPEYIERYKSNSKDSDSSEELTGDGAYYVENYDRSNFNENNSGNQSYTNYGYPGSYSGYPGSYYGYNDPFYSRYNYYGRSYYDPFWNPYYGSGWGMYSGLSLSLSFGSGWGYSPWSPYNAWGYSPWYSRYYYNPWYYDPWYGPSYCGYGYGMGFVGYPSYYSNHYYYTGGIEQWNPSPYNRRVSRGSDNYIVKDGAVPNRRTATVSEQKSAVGQDINNRARTSRDYSRTQNEYYTRSQARTDYGSRVGNSSSISTEGSRSTVGTTSSPRIRSTRSDIDYSRPSYRSAPGSRSSMNTYNYRSTNRSSSSYGNSYQRSRSGSSYSAPSRSSSGYSGKSYSSGSSSRSSYSGGSSAPSRSSSSSGSSSRSSGRR